MGDIRFRRLEQRGARRSGDQIELKMSLPRSPNGMEARLCPQEECAPRLFQLGDVVEPDKAIPDLELKRLHRPPHTAGTTCPYCGHDDEDDHDFVDPRDIQAITDWFEWAAGEDMEDAVGDMFAGAAEVFRGAVLSQSS